MSSICLYLERYKNRSLFGKKLPIPLCSSRDGCLLEPQDDNDRYWSHKRQQPLEPYWDRYWSHKQHEILEPWMYDRRYYWSHECHHKRQIPEPWTPTTDTGATSKGQQILLKQRRQILEQQIVLEPQTTINTGATGQDNRYWSGILCTTLKTRGFGSVQIYIMRLKLK